MISILKNRFPGGKMKVLTLSYDDGTIHDRRLVEIMNAAGLKGAFHLNSGKMTADNKVPAEEIASLFKGHEISAHSVTHPSLAYVTPEQMAVELIEDRRSLESLAGYPVRGMSYPNGSYNSEVSRMLPAYGIEYARTTKSHGGFHFPENFLEWHPTCHHKMDLLQKADEFLNLKPGRPALFYVWGHSYEFDRENNWELIESFAEKMAPHHDTVWFATNIEIVDYLNALKQLRVSVDGRFVRNHSHLAIWLSVNNKPVELAPGELREFCH